MSIVWKKSYSTKCIICNVMVVQRQGCDYKLFDFEKSKTTMVYIIRFFQNVSKTRLK